MALLLYQWFSVLLFSVSHPFYVSVTEIQYNAKDKTLEVSCKIFADDMEEVLKKNYAKSVDLGNEKQVVQNNALIQDYITKNLAVFANGRGAKLQFVGYERDKESVYCYFEIANIAELKKIDVTNSLLQDLNDQQINIMHVVVNGNRKSYKLDYPKKEASFVF